MAAAPTASLEGVVFDLDGTLLDTEPAYFAAYRQTALALGAATYTFEDDHILIVGSQEHAGAVLLVDRLRLDCSPEAFLAKRDEFLGDGFARAGPLPGAVDLVRRASARFPGKVAVATSSSREYLRSKVTPHADGGAELAEAKAALFGPFLGGEAAAGEGGSGPIAAADAVVVCGDDAGPGGKALASKPAPDIFLAAAARVGADPARCIAVEDSPAGVRAAHAAGMRVVFVQGDERVRAKDPAAAALAVVVATGLDKVDWDALLGGAR
ncbi:hypothetical protein FNF29_07197 [Cafeteria roenbergensis]|uniref:Uncharacterized protein n=1 Tax=Cafeteria roenbergensis TaxID=33653 RepID=A0A5A8C3I9_CAFRO|nr:hypothetical protein FNF29_07197 [Cafeteria roenbergensis]|eukprot:KAA0147642.1 hypothetical protein FNF29_07197 [Cafeteria roenbergensis]